MSAPLRIGVAGLGTVGTGVVKLLLANHAAIAERCGREIALSAVSDLDPGREHGINLDSVQWCAATDFADEETVDVVVELIGGEDGPAKALVESALAAGKPVVTANKAMIAHHGNDLAALAERHGVPLLFEAAVAGGIPILKALRESLAANEYSRVYGILNGTCNYILTKMEDSGSDFGDVLAEAQALGYAEADPAFDVEGTDSAHKIAILASIALGRAIDFAAVHIEGIRHVSAADIAYASELGYRIKLLGIAQLTDHGVEQRVHPCMVPLASPIAHVEGVYNAVVAEGDFVGRTVFEGQGAGAGATASAVVGDLMNIARGHHGPPLGVSAADFRALDTAPIERHVGPYYVRMTVIDRPGVLAEVAAVFRDHAVSIESVLQPARSPGEAVPLIMTMHDTEEAGMRAALAEVAKLDAALELPCMIRIEHL